MPEMSFDFEGLIRMIANHLYSEKKVFIRELIQNAHDGIRRRGRLDGTSGRIDIETRPQDLEITVRDNGIGMNSEDLTEYLANIGRSLTRWERENDDGLIGQFGIGFLSAFVVASKVQVITRKVGDERGWLWENEGSKEYRLTEHEGVAIGTSVKVYLDGPENRGMIQEAEVRQLIRGYADMLAVPIHLNGSAEPENTMHMPWEKAGLTAAELNWELRVYVERTLNDRVLEVIPVQMPGPVRADGVLYITRDRLYSVDQPRTIRLFQKRMFVCENQQDVLPQWARFVNGVINSADLTPTAARDNFVRDDKWASLRDALGDLVIEHLEHLRDTDRGRFARIARYHRTSFAAASYHYDEFFQKFADLLLWRTNRRPGEDATDAYADPLDDPDGTVALRTLPEILERLPEAPGQPRTLQCITSVDAARQYFQIANAAGTLVVDASLAFESELLEAYTKLPNVSLRLVHIDRENSSGDVIFGLVNGDDGLAIHRLAESMSLVLQTPLGRIHTEARVFEPPEIAAVLRTDARSEAQLKAEEVLLDPNAAPGIREMAETVARMAHGAGQRLTINARNPLVRRLAGRQDTANPAVQQLMLALYHSAVLTNGQLITARTASTFHDQLQQLMARAIDALESEAKYEALENRLRATKGPRGAGSKAHPGHRTFFMITAFADRYKPLINTCRRVLEDRWGCELVVASDRQEDHRLLDNIQLLMDVADGFIAEITGANPNVMFELGAAFADRRDRPVVLLRENQPANETPTLPADLRGLLYISYSLDDESLAEHLGAEMWKSTTLRKLLSDGKHARYVSPQRLAEFVAPIQLPKKALDELVARYPTAENWQAAEASELSRILGREYDGLVLFIMERVLRALE